MKLIIQIPCYNESETLPQTIDDLPKTVPGFDEIEYLVIDDGSTDRTAQIAESLGVHHVVRMPRNRGLAAAFEKGLQTAVQLGADVIVNTDGDNQYPGGYITDLVRPILDGEADMVIGDRQVETVPHFSRIKVFLQKLGSRIVRWSSGTDVPDATSGFRAFSRNAALRLVIFSNYTYTLETIIQAGKMGLSVTSIPIETNPKLRESRLIRSIPVYLVRSSVTILRIFLMYEALRTFLTLGSLPFAAGWILVFRFLYFFAIGEGRGHVQSLILAAILILVGFLIFLLGLLGDLIARNRRLSEEIVYRVRNIESR
jgi:glycosyltransferase involved in cell wall biosynthesis